MQRPRDQADVESGGASRRASGASDSALDVSAKIRTVIEDWAAFSGWHFSAPGERGLLRLPVPGTTEQNGNCSSCGDGGGSASG